MSTDPWIIAARQLNAEHEKELAENAAREAAAEQKAAKELAAKQALDAAMIEAGQSLAVFIKDRGDAAQILLRACEIRGKKSHVTFGEEHDGTYYRSVYFDYDGLGMEHGFNGISALYGGELPTVQEATPRDAVRMFAYYGAGEDDPDKVREIVTWLTKQIDSLSI